MRASSPAVAVLAGLSLALTACAGGEGGPGPTAAESTDGWGGDAPQMGDSDGGESGGEGSGSDGSGSDGTDGAEGAAGDPPSSSTSTNTGKPFDPEEFTDRLEAAVEENPTVEIEVDVQLDEQTTASATGVQDLAENALDMDVDLGGQQLGYLLVDDQYYLAQPPKWVPVTEDSDNELIRQTLDQIQILSMRNQFDAFVEGVEDAGIKGEEAIDGITTTHYTASVDTATALAELDMEPAEGVPESVIYDVWLDEDDLIRQMSFVQNGVTATMTASNWGEPVDIEEPDESELAEAPESGTP